MTNRTNGHADSGKALAMNRAMRQIADEMASAIINNVHTRPGFYRNQGAGQIDERRDYNAEFGYPTTDMISAYGNDSIYKTLYDRSPIAARVVEVLPDETWKDSPNVWETPDLKCCTSFEREFNQMCECLGGQSWFQDDKVNPLWEYLRRFDIQSGIGHFGIMLLGINDGRDLNEPIEGIDACGFKAKPKTMVSMANPKKPAKQGRKRKLNFVRVFNESMVQVSQWEADRKNPRYGQPTMYNVTFNDLTSAGMTGIGMPTMTADVHWTRVIHLADNPESHESVSVPRMRPVLNNLIDLVKIYGGSGEAFWQAIAPALAFETLPSLGGDVEVDADEIKQQYWDFVNHFQRSLILKGMSAKPLSSPIASPEPQINVHLQAISIKLNMPMRIFMGSERGELSSGQDANEWNMRLKGRRKNVATSRIIVPTVNRLIALDVLPPPDKAFTVAWPDPGLAPTDQATIANTQTTAIAAYVAGGVNALIPEEQFLTKIMGLPEDDVKTMLDAAAEAVSAEGDPELAGPLAQKQQMDADKQQEQMELQQENDLKMAKEGGKQMPPGGPGQPPQGPAGGKPPFPPKKGPPKPIGNANPEGCNQYKPCGQTGASKEANEFMDDEDGYAERALAEMRAMTDAMPKGGKVRARDNTVEWTSGPRPLDDVDVDDQFWDARNRFEDLGFTMEGTSETTGPNKTGFKLVHPSGSTFEATTERGDVGEDTEWRQRTIKLTMNYDPDQLRDEGGRWSTGGGGGAVAHEETAAGWDDADYEDTAYPTEPDYARVGTTHTYKPDVTDDSDGDGVTDHARVGVPAKAVLPPPSVPALPNLTEAEREVEQSFAKAFEADPDGMADKFRQMTVARAKGGAPTFGTDDAKELHAKWSSDQLSLDERSQNRAEYNLALHQTANAITKRAFLQHLDTLPPGSEVMVTCGGCGAGKGYALKNVPEALAMKDRSAVVWDSAGDQNATENPWIQEAAEARGLKVNYVYVHADPETQWAHPERGVVKRAQDPNDGRMVDAKVFADSYALGAQNHQAFYERNQSNPNAKFTFLANGNPPKLLDGIPQEALSIDRNHLAQFAMKTVRDPERAVPPHIIRGATIGARVWKGDLADNSAAVGRRIDAVTINMDPFDAEWEAQVAEERAASEFAGQFFRDRDWQVQFPEERLKPVPLNPNGTEKKPAGNSFCPTGTGGGVDPTCSPKSSGLGKAKEGKIRKDVEAHIKGSRDTAAALGLGSTESRSEQHRRIAIQDIAEKHGLEESVVKRIMGDEEDAAPKPASKPQQEATGGSFSSDFDKAYSALDTKGRGMIPIHALRSALPHYTNEQFNKEVRKLREEGKLSADSSEGDTVAFTDAQRAAGITEGGTRFMYLSKPRTYNAFCPTGEGGGIDNSCGRTPEGRSQKPEGLVEGLKREVNEVADRTEFADGPMPNTDSTDYEAMEDSLDSDQRRDLEEYIRERAIEAWDNEAYSPDISSGDVAEYMEWSRTDTSQEIQDRINGLIDDEDLAYELTSAVDDYERRQRYISEAPDSYTEGAWEAAIAASQDSEVTAKLRNAQDRHVLATREDYQAAEEELLESMEKEASENFINDYDGEADKREWLRENVTVGEISKNTWYETGGSRLGSYELQFDAKNGQTYTIIADKIKPMGMEGMDVRFMDESESFSVTGKGGASDVFMNVMGSLQKLMDVESPEVMTFSAAEPSRRRLYDRIVKTMAKLNPSMSAMYLEHPDGGPRYYAVTPRENKERVMAYVAEKHELNPQILVNVWTGTAWKARLTLNQFCATGPGGGVDPSCGKGGAKADDHSLSGSMGHKEGYDSTEAGDVISKASMAGFEAEHDRLSKEMDERNWDDATAKALRDYTDKNKGGQLNKDARSCTPVPDCTTDPTMFAAVQRETSQPLAEPVTVYRGLYGGYAEKFLAMNPGETEVMKGFVSTSINRQVASDFGESGKGQTQVVLKITAKTGAYVGHVSNFPNELEILQSHGVEYVYKGQSYDKDTGLYTVEMEEK
jgi:antitoxin component of MazEF toxin-antitoxin module